MEQSEPKYEDYVRDWTLDREHDKATHKTGLTLGFVMAQGGKINKFYEHYIPWGKSLYREGFSHEQINAQAEVLTEQFEEICRREFMTSEREVAFQDNKTPQKPVVTLCEKARLLWQRLNSKNNG